MEQPPPNLNGILMESRTIIKASYTDFITLALFFLPLSITLIIGPSTLDYILTFDHETIVYILIMIMIMIMIYILTICGTATITNSTHQHFLNNPVNLQTVLKSLTSNFLPLAFTSVVAHVLMLLISLTCFMLIGLVLMFVQKLGYVVDYNVVFVSFGCVLVVIMMFFYVNWSLANVVVVVESKWGLSALMRSWYLVKGMRFVSLFLMLYFGSLCVVFVWLLSYHIGIAISWIFVLLDVFLGSYFMMVFWLSFTAANTLLYNHCKVLHGELVIEVVEEFESDYVDLNSGVKKFPRVINVAVA